MKPVRHIIDKYYCSTEDKWTIRGALISQGKTLDDLQNHLGISAKMLYLKLRGIRYLSTMEVEKIKRYTGVDFKIH